MFGAGIPPSPDRQERLVVLYVGGTILVVVFFSIMYVVLRQSYQKPDGIVTSIQTGEARLEAYIAEKERASAYQALRDHLDKRSLEPGIAAVFCRDSRHRWVGKQIEFHGEVDMEDRAGRLLAHTYVALLSGDSVHGWTVDSLELRITGFTTPIR